MKGFKNTWVEGVHYDVIPQSEISKINKKISEDSTLNVNYKPERMYSEEDLIRFMQFIVSQESLENTSSVSENTAMYYINQFKKK
jgi:hypothetical protein